MKQNNEMLNDEIKNELNSVGIDITIMESVIAFLDISYYGDFEIKNKDKSNLTYVLKMLINNLKEKFERIERNLNI